MQTSGLAIVRQRWAD